MIGEITQQYLKSILRYDPETGVFTRLVATSNCVKVGNVAGCFHPMGYVHIEVKGKAYKVHRLAVLYMTGRFPKNHIDHINHVKADNRWSNLRECTVSQNKANCGEPNNNTSGYKGVTWNKGSKKWMAQIGFEGKRFYLGYYKNINEAARAYNQAALKYFGEYAYLNEVPESKEHER